MPRCVIINCNSPKISSTEREEHISYHSFPHDATIKEIWIAATGRKDWLPTKHSTICSLHFDNASFIEGKRLRLLKKTACPTIKILKLIDNNDEIGQKTISGDGSDAWQKPDLDAASSNSNSSASPEPPQPYPKWLSGGGKHVSQLQIKRPNDPSSSLKPEEPSSGLKCTVCSSMIAGTMYSCVQCADVLLCAVCERDDRHRRHVVLRLPSERVYNKVRDLFASLQEQFNSKLRVVEDDTEDELADLDDDELNQYIYYPAIHESERPVCAPSKSLGQAHPTASRGTLKTSPPPITEPSPDEPMVQAFDVKVEERDPLTETAAEAFYRITEDVIKNEIDEEPASARLAAHNSRTDGTFIVINTHKCLENEPESKRVKKTKEKTVKRTVTGVKKSAITLERSGNGSNEDAQADPQELVPLEIKEEPPEDPGTSQVDCTGYTVFGSHRST